MLQSNLRTYSRVDRWRAYQPHFPEHIRIEEGHEPAEEYWPWQGAQIHLDRFTAKDAPLTVILLHGGGGCGRLLAPFGKMFQQHGFNAVMPDLPGYGLSEAPAELADYGRWVDCAVDLATAEWKRTGKPVAFFGMSVGGYLALMAGMRFPQTRAVIATTLADPRLPIVRDQFARFPWLNRMLTPFLGPASALFGSLRVPIRWFANMATIANDPELSHLLMNDPVGGANWVTLRFLNSLLNIKPPVEPEDFQGCPVLFAQPAADTWTTLEASQPMFDRLACDKELVLLENGSHLPVEQPGVTELERKSIELLKRVA